MNKIIITGVLTLFVMNMQAKTLIWATEATYPPFESVNSNGKMVGADIDIAKAICKQMKTKCQFVNTAWDSLIPSLKMGKYDVIWGGMEITKARQKQVAFTQPYYNNPVMFVAKKQPGFSVSVTGLSGKTIGVQRGNTMQYYLQDMYGSNTAIKTYSSIQQAFLDLKNGRVDAVLSDQPVIHTWLAKDNNKQNFAYLGSPVISKKYFSGGNGIAVAKNNTQLLAKINAAITDLKKSGQLTKIINEYMS